MRIIIDGVVYSATPNGGVYNYFNELIPRLATFPNTEVEIFVPNVSTAPPQAPGISVKHHVLPTGHWFPEGKVKRYLGNTKRWMEAQIVRARMRGIGKQSVFHTTAFTVSPWKNLPRITTIYDMISEILTPDLQLEHIVTMREGKLRAIRNSERLIAISQCTKDDLCKVYGIASNRVDVIHFGVNHSFFSNTGTVEQQKKIRTKYNLDRPYVLYVGGRLHHKNFPLFAEAYAKSHARKECALAVAGFPFEEHETALIKKLGIEKDIRWMPYLTDELPAVYRMAEYFVFPSLYEGFGLPLIEAMVADCPVAASNTGPFPELAGNAALYFDPHSPVSMRQALDKMMEKNVREEFRARGRVQCRRFSWDNAAKLTMDTYRKALGSEEHQGALRLAGGM